MSLSRPLLLSLLLLLGASAARASTGVQVIGDSRLREQARTRIAAWLANHEHEVAENALGPVALAAIEQCYLGNELACANKVFTNNSKASLLVFVSIEVTGAEGRDRTVRATLWLLKSAGAAERQEKSCRRCDDEEALDMVEDLVAYVGNFDERTGVLRVTSDPQGALVKVDGKHAGSTPLESDQRPGARKLEVTRPGYYPVTREVKVSPGKVREEVIDLVRIPPPVSKWRKRAMVGGAIVGTVALAAGVVAIAVHEGDSCALDQKRCLNTLPTGVVAVAAGSLALGGSAYLWFTQPDDEPDGESPTAASGVRRAPRSFGLGFSARF